MNGTNLTIQKMGTEYPGFSIENFDLTQTDPWANLDTTRLSEVETNKLKTEILSIKALLNLLCSTVDSETGTSAFQENGNLADRLRSKGICSAHQIAGMNRKKFVNICTDELSVPREKAENIYCQAEKIQMKAFNLYLSLCTTEGSDFQQNMLIKGGNSKAADFFKNMPSYQDIFGCLQGCDPSDCRSVFSPAAYFIDLLRIIDKHITQPFFPEEKKEIHPWRFDRRRSDLEKLMLTEENTYREHSYVSIINERLEALSGGPGIYRKMSLICYPVSFPVCFPKERLRTRIREMGVPAEEIYRQWDMDSKRTVFERLGITEVFLDELLKKWSDEDDIKKFCGEIPLDNISSVKEFLFRTELTAPDLDKLLDTGFSEEEKKGGTAHLCFINRRTENNGYLFIDKKPEGSFIAGLTRDIFCDIMRFMRCAAILGISYSDFDWLLRRDAADAAPFAISKEKMLETGTLVAVGSRYKVKMEDMMVLTGPLPVCGKDNLFDRIFNRNERELYHPKDVNPRNPAWNSGWKEWDICDDMVTAGWLADKLNITCKELSSLARMLFPSSIKESSAKISLSQDALGMLYRHVLMAGYMNVTIGEYLVWLKICGLYGCQVFAPHNIERLMDISSGIEDNAFFADYILNRRESVYVCNIFSPDAAEKLLNNTWPAATGGESERQAVLGVLSQFFNCDSLEAEAIAALMPPPPQGLSEYIGFWFQAFTVTLSAAGQEEQRRLYVLGLLSMCSRWLQLLKRKDFNSLPLPVTQNAGFYGIDDPENLTLQQMDALYTALRDFAEYGDFYRLTCECWKKDLSRFDLSGLSSLLGFTVAEIESLPFFNKQQSSPSLLLHRLLGCVKQIRALGADLSFINTVLSWEKSSYDDLDKLSEKLSVRSSGSVTSKKNALLSFFKNRLHTEYHDIESDEDVYKYLLMDVNMDESMKISYIKEGINAAQLYLQRCQMGLERGVGKLEIPGSWWSWIMNYRVWEANRRIFIYPENYLLPGTRQNKTHLFRNLESGLSQSQIDDANVERQYIKYLDEYDSVSQLKPFAAYETVKDGRKTMYIFGHTKATPYDYYYCSSSDNEAFGEWEKINIKIDSLYITPIYIFNRLHILWVETVEDQKVNVSLDKEKVDTDARQAVKVNVKYSFLNLQKEWSTPQSLISDQIICYRGTDDSLGKNFDNSFRMNRECWKRVAALKITKKNFSDNDLKYLISPDDNYECLMVMLGDFAYNFPEITKNYYPMKNPDENDNTRQFSDHLAGMYNRINIMNSLKYTGHFLNGIIRTFNSDMEEEHLYAPGEFFLLDSYEPGQPGITSVLNPVTKEVGIRYTGDPLKENMASHTEIFSPEPFTGKPVDVSDTDFISYTIKPETAREIYDILKKCGIVTEEKEGKYKGKLNVEKMMYSDLYSILKTSFFDKENKTFGPCCFVELRSILYKLAGCIRLFGYDKVFNITPVINRPGAFIYDCLDETFLVTLSKEQAYSLLDESLIITLPRFSYIDCGHLFDSAQKCDNFIEKLKIEKIIDSRGYILPGRLSPDEFRNKVGRLVKEENIPALYSYLYHRNIATNKMFECKDISANESADLYNSITGKETLTAESFSWTRIDSMTEKQKNAGRVLNSYVEKKDPGLLSDIFMKYVNTPVALSVRYKDRSREMDYALNNYVFQVMRLTNASIKKLKNKIYTGGLYKFLKVETQNIPVKPALPFSRLMPGEKNVREPEATDGEQIDFDGLYKTYNWELFYHIPVYIATILKDCQMNEEAKKWFEYIFNPNQPEKFLDTARFIKNAPENYFSVEEANIIIDTLWRLNPPVIVNGKVAHDYTGSVSMIREALFSRLTGSDVLKEEKILVIRNILLNERLADENFRYWNFRPFRMRDLDSLLKDLDDKSDAMRVYNDDPFNPHAIAGLRISAYGKYTVMEYIRNLIDWGDQEFGKYTWESITSATMLYGLASDLLGPKPLKEKNGRRANACFSDIKAAYRDIPQFLIYLESALPPSSVTVGRLSGDVPDTGCSLYFSIPENDYLTSLWDIIEDRLYKIRHSMDILGNIRGLSLYDNPVSPLQAALSAAYTNGTADNGVRISERKCYYRFSYLIEMAIRMTEHLMQLGTSLNIALEKSDNEQIAQLLNTQEKELQQEILYIKEFQIVENQKAREALVASLENTSYRKKYYQDLADEYITGYEKATLALLGTSAATNAASVVLQMAASSASLAPQVGSPFAMKYGGAEIGSSLAKWSKALEQLSGIAFVSSFATGMKAEHDRRKQDWLFQKELAEWDIKNINAQLDETDCRLDVARKDWELQLKIIGQKSKLIEMYQNRFSGAKLYQWMTGQLKNTMLQSYQTAFDLAVKAQYAYRNEYNSKENFIRFQYWNNDKNGLLAGESLLGALHQMKNAQTNLITVPFEIEKDISLMKVCPEAFLMLKGTGACTFNLTEEMFAYDYPGMYMRKIKTVSVTIPALLAPNQTLCATLTQGKNYILEDPGKEKAFEYMYKCHTCMENPPEGVKKDYHAGQKIALSRGINDPGIFQSSGEKYYPFEETGVVSNWTLKMPKPTNPICFDDITDVVIHIRYTALEDSALEKKVIAVLQERITDDRGEYVNVKQFYPKEWHRLMNDDNNEKKCLNFSVNKCCPALAKGFRQGYAMIRIVSDIDISEQESFVSLKIEDSSETVLSLENGIGIYPLEGDLAEKVSGEWHICIDMEKIESNVHLRPLIRDGKLCGDHFRNIELIIVKQRNYEKD